ncbi:hypothetical protein GGG16DRAFT_49843 [Schizophyllum commune]
MQLSFVASFALLAAGVSAAPAPVVVIRAAQIKCPIVECLAALAPTVAICGVAAAQGGVDVPNDVVCLASAANSAVNFPDSCNQCADELGVDIPDIPGIPKA